VWKNKEKPWFRISAYRINEYRTTRKTLILTVWATYENFTFLFIMYQIWKISHQCVSESKNNLYCIILLNCYRSILIYITGIMSMHFWNLLPYVIWIYKKERKQKGGVLFLESYFGKKKLYKNNSSELPNEKSTRLPFKHTVNSDFHKFRLFSPVSRLCLIHSFCFIRSLPSRTTSTIRQPRWCSVCPTGRTVIINIRFSMIFALNFAVDIGNVLLFFHSK